jgi:F-type H+-transporting ATPase subunit gamma
MESVQTIKRRLRSVQSIGQITKAMELVAATKMRKAQEIALTSRPYIFASLEMLANISAVLKSKQTNESVVPTLLQSREIKRTAVVVIASDKGLTGAFNSSVFRQVDKYLANTTPDAYIGVGQKAVSYLQKRAGQVDQSFVRVGDFTTLEQVEPIARYLTEGYKNGEWDEVVIFYTNFKSALRQEVLRRELFPIDLERIQQAAHEVIPETGRFADLLKEQGISFFQHSGLDKKLGDYVIEPSPEELLEDLLPHLVLIEVYNIILEANASEHASRRIAMKNASDNANEVKGNLTLEYNKSRQATITRELIEITAGAEALTS